VTKVRSAKARTGKVIAQSIAPGYTVPPGAKVSVLVGKGRR
jgi:beta-lactam-binding protein with PASTA domain